MNCSAAAGHLNELPCQMPQFKALFKFFIRSLFMFIINIGHIDSFNAASSGRVSKPTE